MCSTRRARAPALSQKARQSPPPRRRQPRADAPSRRTPLAPAAAARAVSGCRGSTRPGQGMHNYARVGRRHGRGARAWHFHIGHRQLVTLPIQEWPRLARARRLRHRGNERGVRCGVAEAAEAEPPVAAAMHAQGDAGATGLLGLPELQRAKGSKVPE